MKSPLSSFLKDYEFYRIKNSKTILFAYLDVTKGKIYLKSKEAFIEEIYNISLQYNTSELNIITEVKSKFVFDNRMNNASVLYDYLLNNNGIKLIEDIIFKPIPQRLLTEQDGLYLNEYTPTKYLDPKFNNGCKNENSFPYIKSLLMNLCNNDLGAYEYLLKVLSHSITSPHIKRHGFIVLQGEGASGKGTFFDLLMKPIFENYFIADNEDVLRTQFNEYSNKAIWIFIEEKEDTRGKGSLASAIKYVTGNSKVISEAKGKDRRVLDDYRNWGITTNETNPGLDLKEHDRRATILGYSRALGGFKSEAPKVRKVLEQKIPVELDDFVSYLKNLEFDFTDIYNAYENEARQSILLLDMSNVGLFIEDLRAYKDSLLNHILSDYEIPFSDLYLITREDETHICFKDVYNMFVAFCKKNNLMRVTKENKFGKEFNNITGLETKRIKDKNKLSYFYRLKDFLNYFNLKIEFTFIDDKQKYDINKVTEDKAQQIEQAWTEKEVVIDDTYI